MELYTAGTGNGQRGAIAVNECDVPCTMHVLNLAQGDQRQHRGGLGIGISVSARKMYSLVKRPWVTNIAIFNPRCGLAVELSTSSVGRSRTLIKSRQSGVSTP